MLCKFWEDSGKNDLSVVRQEILLILMNNTVVFPLSIKLLKSVFGIILKCDALHNRDICSVTVNLAYGGDSLWKVVICLKVKVKQDRQYC